MAPFSKLKPSPGRPRLGFNETRSGTSFLGRGNATEALWSWLPNTKTYINAPSLIFRIKYVNTKRKSPALSPRTQSSCTLPLRRTLNRRVNNRPLWPHLLPGQMSCDIHIKSIWDLAGYKVLLARSQLSTLVYIILVFSYQISTIVCFKIQAETSLSLMPGLKTEL